MRTLRVHLGSRSYAIHVGAGLLANAAEMLCADRWSSAVILTHPGLLAACAAPVAASLRGAGLRTALLCVPAGERQKSLRTAARLYDSLLDASADRRSLLVSVGGGVLGDLGGFVAATYLRGIAFAQIPTTLLAQVDASVGGKTGVDLRRGKNLVGAFHQPRAVIADVATLRTLPRRELRAGLAEVIKYGIISDGALLDRLLLDMPRLLSRDPEALAAAVLRSCEIKADVVARDETEQGPRAILNFGHTVAHALESETGYRRYRHGEAVSIGMVSAALIGEEAGVTPGAVTARILQAVQAAGLPCGLPPDVRIERMLEGMRRDKKATGGRLRFVLALRPGEVTLVDDVAPELVARALERHRRLAR
ncbi:MAG: 3-dehydroquinate synthase [Chthonomonadales bacterium]|nr:3-dehydroquinate synthase [Chthonomonadales bacterium]